MKINFTGNICKSGGSSEKEEFQINNCTASIMRNFLCTISCLYIDGTLTQVEKYFSNFHRIFTSKLICQYNMKL